MCADGADLGHSCRLCGKPLLSCWDDGPSISWHADEADAEACLAHSAPMNAPNPDAAAPIPEANAPGIPSATPGSLMASSTQTTTTAAIHAPRRAATSPLPWVARNQSTMTDRTATTGMLSSSLAMRDQLNPRGVRTAERGTIAGMEFQPPIYGDRGPAPTGVCSRWMGDSPCGAAGTHHVIWDSEMANGCVCAVHHEEIRQNWVYVGLHPYTAACASPGSAFWLPDEDRCEIPPESGAEVREAMAGVTP